MKLEMLSKSKLDLKFPSHWLTLSLIVVLVLGIFFRFVNLDQKAYWTDESFTSLRVAGGTIAQVREDVFDNQVIGVEDLQKYQRINPEKSIWDTIEVLAIEDSQHPPLYYVVTRWWIQMWGDSIAAKRSISAVLSLLAFPCMYWLCLELFGSSLVGWLAIALLAISPLQTLYAQEAREYSFWVVTILLLSAAFLSAIRVNTKLRWGIYALTLAIGLYTFPLTLLVLIGHGIYILVNQGVRLSRTLRAYLFASSAGLAAFSPWILVSIAGASNINSSTSWTSAPIPPLPLAKIWILNLTRGFFDIKFDFSNPLTYLILPILILIGYAIYWLCRTTPKRVWLFVLLLMGITTAVLVMPDLILGGRRSTVPRLLMPTYLGLYITVAYLLSTKINSHSFSDKKQRVWRLVLAMLLTVSIVSNITYSQSESWWNKYKSNENFPIAEAINKADFPLVISDTSSIGNTLSLSHYLDDKVKLKLMDKPQFSEDIHNYSDVFIFEPSKELLTMFDSTYNTKLIHENQLTLLKLEDKV